MNSYLLLANADISIGQGALLSLVSIAIIMGILVAIMGLTLLMSLIMKKTEGKTLNFKNLFSKIKKQSSDAYTTKTAVSADEPARGSCGSLILENVSDRDAAMIMAIVADSLETPLNELRFKSIKEIK